MGFFRIGIIFADFYARGNLEVVIDRLNKNVNGQINIMNIVIFRCLLEFLTDLYHFFKVALFAILPYPGRAMFGITQVEENGTII